jgi:hypothetical protein
LRPRNSPFIPSLQRESYRRHTAESKCTIVAQVTDPGHLKFTPACQFKELQNICRSCAGGIPYGAFPVDQSGNLP